MTEPRGALLGDRYLVGEVIGRGGMADVRVATDQVLGRDVAVKVLRAAEPDPTDRARFVDEARTLARLSHPNLVTVLDAGTSDERPYLVMELVPGITLADAFERGPIAPGRAAAIGAQVADALAYVHGTGIVHRDVKPGNVLLHEDGRARLTDFGIARLVADTAHHTRTGTTIGSPAYFSPEQVGGGTVTTASDVYSLGLVLLEALTGRRPFEGTPTEVALARLSRGPDLPATLPPGWAPLLDDLTARDPLARPDATQVAQRLRDLAAGGTGAASSDATSLMAAAPDPTVTAPAATVTRPTAVVPPAPAPARDERKAGVDGDRAPERRRRPWLVPLLVGIVLVGALTWWLVAGGAKPVPDVPQDVPAELQDPLQDLHDAVEEAGR